MFRAAWSRMRGSLPQLASRRRPASKGDHELAYWRSRQSVEGVLGNDHYERLYTEMFGVDREFYRNKAILDIGCGPRGSLEWATDAAERIGLDPLVDRYRELGIDRHAMTYVEARSEEIPFPDGHFDVVTSINSLDHVDDPDQAMREIGRVLAPGGAFLLEVEVGHKATPTEPISLWFDILDFLSADFETLSEHRYEMPPGKHLVHDAYRRGAPFDMRRGRHPGVLVARLRRRAA